MRGVTIFMLVGRAWHKYCDTFPQIKMSRQPTIIDVAVKCGYSKSTVSLVLQGSKEIPASTQAKVMEAIQELGYRQNQFAQGLRTSRSHAVGMVILDHLNPFYSELVQHVERRLREKGFDLIVSSSNSDRELERQVIERLFDRHVDGMIVSPLEYKHVAKMLKLFNDRGTPCVVAGSAFPLMPLNGVTIDYTSATRDVVEHLFSLEHHDIAFIWGAPSYQGIGSRFKEFQRVLKGHGVSVREDWIVHCGVRLRDGYNAACQLLGNTERPTAIFALNDLLATGVIRGAMDMGLSVPGDVSVVGVDDVELSSFLCPSLTTISQPISDYADALTSLVIEGIEGKEQQLRHIKLSARLVIRESTGPAPKAKNSYQLESAKHRSRFS